MVRPANKFLAVGSMRARSIRKSSMIRLMLLLAFLAVFTGCGEAKKALPKRFPVTGSVTYNGQPPKGATVQFERTTPAAEGVRVPKPGATVQADGSFKLSSYE